MRSSSEKDASEFIPSVVRLGLRETIVVLCRGRVGCVAGGGFWGGLEELIYEMGEKKYGVIEVCPEEYMDGSGSDITLSHHRKIK